MDVKVNIKDLFKKPDKRHHAVYSFAICITLCLIFRFVDYVYLWASLVTLGIGIYKEYKDKGDPAHNAEFADIVADAIGILVAVALYCVSGIW